MVTIPASVRRVLQDVRITQLQARLQSGAAWTDLDLIFATRTGTPLDYRVLVQRHFKPLAALAGLPGLRPYDLRHTCATLLLGAGENIKVVSERLGHSTAAVTLDVYSHFLADMQQKAAERMEELLFSPIVLSSACES